MKKYIALFKKHIVDSEHILFENTDDYVELQWRKS